jgi:hypothetical protein
VSEGAAIQAKVREAQAAGVHITVGKACADQLGVTERLEALGIEVMYWGEPLTKFIKNDAKRITI